MSLFTIADLHLSSAADHPMDVFGSRWQGYTEKICKNWRAVVGENDTVILPGDISWAMNLPEAREDFALLDALPGKKLLGKGNHDFWWETATKLHRFFDENNFTTLSLLYNNAHVAENFIVCGTRGWFLEEEKQLTVGDVDFSKIQNRELQRLKLSLDAAVSLREGEHAEKEILVFLHFPPVWNGFVWQEFIDMMREYGVRRVFCGHIHGVYNIPQKQELSGLEITLISSDFLNFVPYIIK
ncbi:MAG: serine/threonine protein phosphatase [Ruminococcaceae bacterium]|nr:serine/threonine protein phosphatase [Oscillospiraceae bacterium]